MIYVSTGGFRDLTGPEAAASLREHGIDCVELSGGRVDPNWLVEAEKLKEQIKFRLHNYFPPPETPFVLNLASSDADVRNHSLAFCQQALRAGHSLGDDTYGVHAGFLIDPQVQELGRRIRKRHVSNRAEGLERFHSTVLELADFARQLDMRLLIENNVLTAGNLAEFGENPLLLVEPQEIAEFMKAMPSNVGLLVDVAHLKVSAQTLGFDPTALFILCDPWIVGYHLSDNDGRSDSNEPISLNSWFWPYLKKDLSYYTLEVYGQDEGTLFRQVQIVKEWRQS